MADKKLNPHSVALNQLYNLIKEESVSKISLDEVKSLMNFVRDQSASQRLSDDIDVADLINAILDVTG